MNENGKELDELRRAHAVRESRVEAILPTLATKADLEAMGSRIITQVDAGFQKIWYWIATALVLIIASLFGLFVTLFTTRNPPAPPVASVPSAVTYHVYQTLPAPPALAPPSQP